MDKPLLLFLSLACLLSTSCTISQPEVTVGDISAKGGKKFGGKQLIIVERGDTRLLIGDNNEQSFRDGTSLGKWGIAGWTLSDIVGTGASAAKSITATKSSAKVANTAVKEQTKQIGLQEVTKQKSIEVAAEAIVE